MKRVSALFQNTGKVAAILAMLVLLSPVNAQPRDQIGSPSDLEQQRPENEIRASLDRETLGTAMQSLLDATIARDLESTLSYVPPRKIQKIAESMGKSRREAIIELTKIGREQDRHSGIEVISGHYDLDAARFGKTSAGRDYALLPYSRTFKGNGETFELTYLALASMDDGQLFITPLSDDTLMPELIELYPDLAEIAVPGEITAR